jgi:diacylglycerol kinase family enzyme
VVRTLRGSSAALIINPNSGRLRGEVRQDVIDALRARLGIEILAATARDAGIGLAREAADSGADVVIAFGGDGHVNEVANGVAGTRARLGIVPGGTMNVFSRALGIPQDPFGAIDRLVDALGREPRAVPLGRMDDRLFTFSAGCGFDADVADRVERFFAGKRRFGELFFYWSAVRVLAQSAALRAPFMTLRGRFGEVPAAMAIACNAGPYAYLAGRPVELTPKVRLDGGLDLFSLRRMRLEVLPLYAWCVAVSRDLTHQPDVFYESDLEAFEIEAESPFPRHVDGEPLPAASSARFSVERDALLVAV